MNWQKLFSKIILDRGYEYYCCEAVEEIDFSNNMITASVSGSDDYHVEITLSDGEIEDMYCSCPYAAEGKYCKHMAAVLYEWTEMKDSGKMEKNQNDILFRPAETVRSHEKKHSAVEKLVFGADENDVRSFLVDILTDNEKLCLRFYNTVNRESLKIDVKNYFRQVDSIFREYVGRDHFIDYDETEDLIMELEEFIDNDVKPMIDSNNYFCAFEITYYICDVISNTDIDDPDCEIGMLADSICQLWLGIIKKADRDNRRKIFDRFISRAEQEGSDDFDNVIEKLIAEAFDDKEFEKEKLDFFEKMIAESEKQSFEWQRAYNVQRWAVRYLDMLIKINSSDEHIEKVFRNYCKYTKVRQMYIDSCLRKKEYDKAIGLLDEGISESSEYSGLVSDYSRQKKEIYLLTENKTAYVEQLWSLVLKHDAGNMEFYRELKAQYSDSEWAEQREKIFKRLPKSVDISKYYEEEKQYDRLLECVLKSSGLYMTEQYRDVLMKDYPEQLLEKYRSELEKMAVNPYGRRYYADMVAIMRRMRKISGGKIVVGQIAEEWREKYRNRLAMMDELSKL